MIYQWIFWHRFPAVLRDEFRNDHLKLIVDQSLGLYLFQLIFVVCILKVAPVKFGVGSTNHMFGNAWSIFEVMWIEKIYRSVALCCSIAIEQFQILIYFSLVYLKNLVLKKWKNIIITYGLSDRKDIFLVIKDKDGNLISADKSEKLINNFRTKWNTSHLHVIQNQICLLAI